MNGGSKAECNHAVIESVKLFFVHGSTERCRQKICARIAETVKTEFGKDEPDLEISVAVSEEPVQNVKAHDKRKYDR